MSIFENSFFSVKGQLERLSNVKNTLVAAITGKGVQAHTGSTTVNKVLETAASNPFATAAVAAVAVNPVAAGKAAVTAFKALPASGKVAAVIATPVVAGAVASNPKLITSAAKAPQALSNVGSNIASFIENPSLSSAVKIVKENPVISGTAIIATAAAVGGGIGLAANTAATFMNTRATKENSVSTMASTTDLSSAPVTSKLPTSELIPSKSLTPSPQEAPTANLVATKTMSPRSSSKRHKRKAKRLSLPSYGVQQTKVLNIIHNKVSSYG